MDSNAVNYMDIINKNLMIVGICSIINAFGIRFLWDDLNDQHKNWFNSAGIKKIVVFTLLFVTTRNILITIFLFLLYLNFRKYLKHRDVEVI
jgi:hypothetical protein